jgi:hypothetical protein
MPAAVALPRAQGWGMSMSARSESPSVLLGASGAHSPHRKRALKRAFVKAGHFSAPGSSASSKARLLTRLVIRVHEGKDLLVSDLVTGTSDPVAFVWVASREAGFEGVNLSGTDPPIQRTDVKRHTVDPIWDSEMTFPLKVSALEDVAAGSIYIVARDQDDEDGEVHYDELGHLVIPLQSLMMEGQLQPKTRSVLLNARWWPLSPPKGTKKSSGSLKVSLGLFVGEDNPILTEGQSFEEAFRELRANGQQSTGTTARWRGVLETYRPKSPTDYADEWLSPRRRSRSPVRSAELPPPTTLSSSGGTFSLKPLITGRRGSHQNIGGFDLASPMARTAPPYQGSPGSETLDASDEEGFDTLEEPPLLHPIERVTSRKLAAMGAAATKGGISPLPLESPRRWRMAMLQSFDKLIVRGTEALALGELLALCQGASSSQAAQIITAARKVGSERSIASRRITLHLLSAMCRSTESGVMDAVGRAAPSILRYILARACDKETQSLRPSCCLCFSTVLLLAAPRCSAIDVMKIVAQVHPLVLDQTPNIRQTAGRLLECAVHPSTLPSRLRMFCPLRHPDEVRLVLSTLAGQGGCAPPKDIILLPNGELLLEFYGEDESQTFHAVALDMALPSGWQLANCPSDEVAREELARMRYAESVSTFSEPLLAALLEALDSRRSIGTRAHLLRAAGLLTNEGQGVVPAVTKGLPALLSRVIDVLSCDHRRCSIATAWREHEAAARLISELAQSEEGSLQQILTEWKFSLLKALRSTAARDTIKAVRDAACDAIRFLGEDASGDKVPYLRRNVRVPIAELRRQAMASGAHTNAGLGRGRRWQPLEHFEVATPFSTRDDGDRNDDCLNDDDINSAGEGPASHSRRGSVKSRKLGNAMMAVAAFKGAGKRADTGEPIAEDKPGDSDLGTCQGEDNLMSPHEEPASSKIARKYGHVAQAASSFRAAGLRARERNADLDDHREREVMPHEKNLLQAADLNGASHTSNEAGDIDTPSGARKGRNTLKNAAKIVSVLRGAAAQGGSNGLQDEGSGEEGESEIGAHGELADDNLLDEEKRETHDHAGQKFGSVTKAIYKLRSAGTRAKSNVGKESEGVNGLAVGDEVEEVEDEGESLLVQAARSAGDESLPTGHAHSFSRSKSAKLASASQVLSKMRAAGNRASRKLRTAASSADTPAGDADQNVSDNEISMESLVLDGVAGRNAGGDECLPVQSSAWGRDTVTPSVPDELQSAHESSPTCAMVSPEQLILERKRNLRRGSSSGSFERRKRPWPKDSEMSRSHDLQLMEGYDSSLAAAPSFTESTDPQTYYDAGDDFVSEQGWRGDQCIPDRLEAPDARSQAGHHVKSRPPSRLKMANKPTRRPSSTGSIQGLPIDAIRLLKEQAASLQVLQVSVDGLKLHLDSSDKVTARDPELFHPSPVTKSRASAVRRMAWKRILLLLKHGDAQAAFQAVLRVGTERALLKLLAHASDREGTARGYTDLCHTLSKIGMATRAELFSFLARMLPSPSLADHIIPWVYALVLGGGSKMLPRAVQEEVAESLHDLSAHPTDTGLLAARLIPYFRKTFPV